MDDSNDAAPPASSADLAAGSLPPPNPNVADDAPSGEVAAADPTSTPNTSAPPPNDSDASSSVKPSVPEASSLARPMSPTSPAAAPDPSPSYTMIYPLRSLLSDIQPSDPNDPQNKPQTRTAPVFPHVMPTPSLATASMADPFKSRFSYESPIVPTLNRSSSISQRRTAQWQANMSDKSGKASSPSSPDVRDIALASPLVSPTTTGKVLD
ncbi:hypothetical protein DL93DRAFT_121273 [Clavulina sp. PMI_390]|nr:hypothetical protein DL93DRAFT_121273 [Clavulina sp. PMI_390]